MKTQSSRKAFRITLIYITVAGVWNWCSNVLLKHFAGALNGGLNIDLVTDWGFTIVMAGFLYQLIRRLLRQREKEMEQRKASENDFRRTQRALKTISACNGVLVRAASEAMLLTEICRVVVEQGGHRLAWVGFAINDEPRSVRIAARSGYDHGYLEQSRITWSGDDERGRGPTGAAIRTGQIIVCNDFLSDPKVALWRNEAARRGYASNIVLPLRNSEKTFGVLTIYSAETNAFNSTEVELLKELADDLAYGIQALRTRIERARAEQSLRAAEENYRRVFESARDAICILDPVTGKFISGNPAALKMYGMESEAEFISHGPQDFSPERQPDGSLSADSVRARNEKLMREGQQFFGWKHRRLDGIEFMADVLLTRMECDGKQLVLATVRDITQRRHAEELLRQERELYLDLVNNQPAGIYRIRVIPGDQQRKDAWSNSEHAPYCFELASDRLCEILGVQRADFTTNPGIFMGLVHSEDKAEFARQNEEAGISLMPFRWEGRLVIGGKITWVHIESRPRPAANGDMIWTGILYDITNRKQTERFLSFIAEEGWSGSQGDFFARLVEYIGRALGVDYVLIGRRKDDQTVQTTGLYARGRIVPDMEYSTRGAPCQNVIGKILCHHSDHLQEMFPEDSLVAEMGAQSYLAIPLTDSSGKPLGLMAVLDTKPMPDAQLVTAFLQIAAVRVAGEIERRAKVDELHWKTALMEAQMEAAPDGILMIDNQGRRILQNQRMNDLLKIPPHISGDEDDRVQFSFVASRAKDPAKMKDKVAYLDAHPEEISRDELEFVDGTIVDRYSSPVRDKLGRSCGRIWTFRDITQARQLEMQLRQSQKMEGIGQLAGGVAHDFNNILAAMLMQTDLMGMVEQLPGEVVEGLQQIRADANRAADLTRQLLLFSRRQVMQASVFDLNELVTSLAKMLQRIIGEDIRLQLHLHAAPLWMRADAGMIDQIIMNLAVNARDAMSTGGRLEIETAQKHVTGELAGLYPDAAPGDYACLSVSDTGGGIPLDILPRIFEPFFTTKAPGKGTGLGLATVFGIVKQHHGWIKVDNRHGLGVTFQIFLPTSSEGSTQASKVEARAKSIGGKETILLVEDEPAVRRLISSLLERHGYQVVAASNGVEAVDLWLAQSRKVALLLTDLVMPGGMTGHELARQLQSRQSNLKIVFMSGYSPEIAGREFELRQGENFVQKPFAADRLLETIRQSLDV